MAGDIYWNSLATSFFGIIGMGFSGYLSSVFDNLSIFKLGYLISCIAAFLYVPGRANFIVVVVLISLCRIGNSFTSNIANFIVYDYFPTKIKSTVYGICNISGRIIAIFAPLVAEIKDPKPMIIFSVLNLLCIILIEFTISKTGKSFTTMN